MALIDLAAAGQNIPLAQIPAAEAHELQDALCRLGLLDPIISGSKTESFGPKKTSDGQLGGETRAAIREFCRLVSPSIDCPDGFASPEFLRTIHADWPDHFLPIHFETLATDGPQTVLAKRILKNMSQKGLFIARSPNARNIIYVEGMNADGSLNADRFNEWNDRRMVISIINGEPRMLINDEATSEPGRGNVHAVGVARVAFGQYKAWKMGIHGGSRPHPALRQASFLRIHRDRNRDNTRAGDIVVVEEGNGINQHSTRAGEAPFQVGRFSAGCLVGRRMGWHESFLEVLKTDFRFEASSNYLFVATILAGDSLS